MKEEEGHGIIYIGSSTRSDSRNEEFVFLIQTHYFMS
jgi:hypothetical protein